MKFAKLSVFKDGGLLAELQVELGFLRDFDLNVDGVLYFRGQMCVPVDQDLRHMIHTEAHSSPYAMHPSGNRMYRDLWVLYWWPGLRKDIANFVGRCLVCQRVKAEHQRPSELLQPIRIPEWK
ncbi:uncharacterized protein LOC108487910 [Gossypium arboreum]|uniref:uncharacterized protein LOC108487910 n=1 Tax=Gossypium arboreum TaxID=29729 RepID=UPI0008196D73|nr:uncharacterized protein LOC108487910 [Gossypium arboreum]